MTRVKVGANHGVRTSSSCLSSMARAFTIGPRSLSTDEDILVNLKSLGLEDEEVSKRALRSRDAITINCGGNRKRDGYLEEMGCDR